MRKRAPPYPKSAPRWRRSACRRLSTGVSCALALSIPTLSHAAAALDAARLESEFDAIVPAQLRHDDVAGAAIVVVQAGRVVFAKGYGLADVASGTPVSAGQTLFRLGSVSKLFTWEAVMQQVEEGRIDLDRDIDDYLDFRVPGAAGRPITMRQLMTHTAGFEDGLRGLWAPDAASVGRLREYLVEHMPARIFAPGTVPGYSNYGAALAGYIVQRVSGVPFEQYVEQRIIGPLGMRHTTVRQPVPPALAPGMSRGYERAGAAPRPFEFMRAPAGGVSASAQDIGRFMIAQLAGGTLDGQRILSAAGTAQMLTPAPGWPAGGNAMALGWLSLVEEGPRTLWHDGATLYFQSVLNLYPDSDAGLFVVLNSRGVRPGATLGRIEREFTHRNLPMPPTVVEPTVVASCPDDMGGAYLPTRRSETGMGYGAALALQWRLRCDAGRLQVVEPGATVEAWRPVAPFVWRSDDGTHLRLRRGADGRWEAIDGNPVSRFQQGRWYDDARLPAALACGALVALIASAMRGLRTAWRARRLGAMPPTAAMASGALLLPCAAGVLLAVAAAHVEWALQPWFDRTLDGLQAVGWAGVASLLLWLRPGRRRDAWDWFGWGGAALLALLAWHMNLLAPGPRY